MIPESELQKKIATLLRDAEIPFEKNVSVGGLKPDFLVTSPRGRRFVIEAKGWTKHPGFTTHAADQARLFAQAVNADGAFLVLDALGKNLPDSGVVTPDGLVKALHQAFDKSENKARKLKKRLENSKRTIFAAMPFSPEYEDAFFVAMAPAAAAVKAACIRLDREEYAGDSVMEISKRIRSSVAVIVDLSESKPNVLFEAGFAHALKKPTIHICSTPLEKLPFDVRNWNTLTYQKGNTTALKRKLIKTLKELVAPGE